MMEEPIKCWKCQSIPFDVLMMNCNHHLCVKCAEGRLSSQNITKTMAGKQYLTCEKCKSKTNLDEESISELEKAKKNKGDASRQNTHTDKNKRVQTPINSGKVKAKSQQNELKQSPIIDRRKKQQTKQSETPIKQDNNKKQKSQRMEKNEKQKSLLLSQKKASMQSYGECEAHQDEPVMYYCFTCKIHCFCAECVLVGKHNQHEVKTITKAYAKVQKQIEQAVASTRKFINSLHQKNQAVVSDINNAKNKADQIKRSIEKGFDEVRAVIRQKELQFMKTIDQQFSKMMETSNGLIKKAINSKLEEQQTLLDRISSQLQKGESASLNMYSDGWGKIKEGLAQQTITLPQNDSSLDEAIISYINKIKRQIENVIPEH